MKKFMKLMAGAMAMTMALTACGGNSGSSGSETNAPKESTTAGNTADTEAAQTTAEDGGEASGENNETLKVALILPGKKDDVSFNQAMYEGITAYAEAHPGEIDLKVTENVYEVADIEPALMDFADMGYDVIFGHGFQFMEPIVKVAPNYPDTCFLLGTGYKSVDNSAVYDVHLQSGGYLMGVVAALATESGKIGVVGGANAAEIYRGHEAFKAGARSVNRILKSRKFIQETGQIQLVQRKPLLVCMMPVWMSSGTPVTVSDLVLFRLPKKKTKSASVMLPTRILSLRTTC